MITILHRGGGVSRDPQMWLRNMCTTPINISSTQMTIFFFQSQYLSSSDFGKLGTGWSKSAGPYFLGPNLPRTTEIVLESILARECVGYNLKSEAHISWSLKYWIQCKGSRQKPFAALFRAFLHQPPLQRRENHQVIGQFWYMCRSLLN